MKVIWKYTLEEPPGAVETLEVPKGSILLSVGAQGSARTVWMLVDSEAPKVDRRFVSYFTGQAIDTPELSASFVGRMDTGLLVWHLYDLGEK